MNVTTMFACACTVVGVLWISDPAMHTHSAIGDDQVEDDTIEVSRETIVKAEALAQSGQTYELNKLLAGVPAVANAKDQLGQTPLFYAARYNQLAAAKMLLKYGATWTVICEGNGYETPVHVAARSDSVEVLQLFLDSGADVNILGEGPDYQRSRFNPSSYLSPLDAACSAGSLKTAKLLISRGAKLDVNPVSAPHPSIHRAVSGRNRLGYCNPRAVSDKSLIPPSDNHEIIELLIESGATFDDLNAMGETPFLDAVSRGSHDIVDYLLEEHSDRIDVNSLTPEGMSALHLVADRPSYFLVKGAPDPHVRMVEILRRHGADATLICGSARCTAAQLAKKRKASNELVMALEP